MEPGEAFGRALRQQRKAAQVTQDALALGAGLERVFVSWLETGKKQSTVQTMLKLAEALNCSAADLVAEAKSLLHRARR